MKAYYFKATKQTNRFNKNQKVWVIRSVSYHQIRFKWRGKGRYVNGIISYFSPVVGPLREADVTEEFWERLGYHKTNT